MPKLKTGTVLPTEVEDVRIREGIAEDPNTYEVTDTKEWAEMKPVYLSQSRTVSSSCVINQYDGGIDAA